MKFSLSELILRELTPDEMREAYVTDMVNVFPECERKPVDGIYEDMLIGKFLACGLFAGGELVAYAFSAKEPQGDVLFTQYVVVKEQYRALGVGGVLVEKLAALYKGCRFTMVDVEDPERAKDAAERAYREKRMRFYTANGFRRTRVRACVCGVDYEIMILKLAGEPQDEDVYGAARAIYGSMAKPGAFPFGFHVTLRPEERGMERATWKRMTERRFRKARVDVPGFSGIAGVIDILAVKAPLVVKGVWDQTVIADAGYSWLQLAPDAGGWWLTVMYDDKGRLLQYYFDITLRNFVAPDGEPRFVDLFLDVLMDASGKWILLDRDELDEALALGNIAPEEHALAVARAEKVIRMVDGKEAHWRALCAECLRVLRDESHAGEGVQF